MIESQLEDAIAAATGEAAVIVSTTARGGGSINEARIATLADGRRYFFKTNARADRLPGMFGAEYRALELLGAAAAIRVPVPIAASTDFIVMEAFEAHRPVPDWQEQMGRQLACLHQATRRDHFGLDFDNFIGTTPQSNAPLEDWVTFWRARRLEPQLELFAADGNQSDPLIALGGRLSEYLDEVLAEPAEPAVLLHGDLWSGNAAADERGAPIIYDPASYYGRREAEIGMMRMFGGFDDHCYAAYAEVWPLADGSEQRIAVYGLYHELNHLNLFGHGYYDRCVATMRAVL
ncbi:MAG TPA: fructosamine kinase family protein [Gammaproteobacteria bacterium]|nr:fructosamine kinase family protein [Gammaproteobacteria bacterium]